MPRDRVAGAGQFSFVRGGQGADRGGRRFRFRAAASGHQQQLQRLVAAVQHRIMPVRRKQQPSLLLDARTDGVAVARLHGGIVVGDLEPERRLPGRVQFAAAEHHRWRIGSRYILQLGLEHRIGRQRDALAIHRGALQRAGPGRTADQPGHA